MTLLTPLKKLSVVSCQWSVVCAARLEPVSARGELFDREQLATDY
jgi:hypothetical protein